MRRSRRFLVAVPPLAIAIALLLGTIGRSGAAVTVVPISPSIAAQFGGPPLPTLTFARTADLTAIDLNAPLAITLNFVRNGDFNNPTTASDANGAPLEGTAVFLVSQTPPGNLHLISYEPGIPGSVHDIGDDPINRQPFSATIPQATLDEAFDGQFAHFLFAFGNSIDDLSYFNASLTIEMIPEPTTGALLVFAFASLRARRRSSGLLMHASDRERS
jgi:hypothetical protein